MWLTQPFSAPVRFAAPTRRAGRAAPAVLTSIIPRTSADVSTPIATSCNPPAGPERNAARVTDDLHTRTGSPTSHRQVAAASGAERGRRCVGTTEITALAFVGAFWVAAICAFVVWHGRRKRRRTSGNPERGPAQPR